MKHAARTAIAFAFASLCFSSGAGATIVTFQVPVADDGTFTPFDFDGAYSTVINLINDKGMIAGNYRSKDGFFGFIGKP